MAFLINAMAFVKLFCMELQVFAGRFIPVGLVVKTLKIIIILFSILQPVNPN